MALAEKEKNDEIESRKRKEAERQERHAKEREKMAKLENELCVKEKEQHNILNACAKLLQEAEGKLSDAIKAGNTDQLGVSHGLLEVARKRMDGANVELGSIASKRKHMAEKLTHLGEPAAKKKVVATSTK